MSDIPANCQCVSVPDAVRYVLAEQPIPICAEHDQRGAADAEQPSATALNSAALVDAVRASVGTDAGSFAAAFRALLNANETNSATTAHN